MSADRRGPESAREPREYADEIYRRYLSLRAGTQCEPTAVSNASPAYYYEAKLAKWLPADPGASILDLGCGAGRFVKWLSQKGYSRLAGVDRSPEQIMQARAAAPAAELYELDLFSFLQGKQAQYDLIAALDVIEHMDKAQVLEFLRLVFAALKPGGRLLLQTPNADSPWALSLRYGDFTHECCLTPGSLRQLLLLAGFEDVEAQPTGPVAHGLKSSLRWFFWRLISCYYMFVNLVETGRGGDGIYTRVFQASARKPAAAKG
jgi:2-polyprenyl-3-methyl-5-hydroxy-6-metoxy-1,4-benzoquinol methylase